MLVSVIVIFCLFLESSINLGKTDPLLPKTFPYLKAMNFVLCFFGLINEFAETNKAMWLGAIMSSQAAGVVIGTIIIGKLSDVFGRRQVDSGRS